MTQLAETWPLKYSYGYIGYGESSAVSVCPYSPLDPNQEEIMRYFILRFDDYMTPQWGKAVYLNEFNDPYAYVHANSVKLSEDEKYIIWQKYSSLEFFVIDLDA